MEEYLKFAKDLAYKAGALIKNNFDTNSDLGTELKADHSPVTAVDKEINQLVIEAIKTTYPVHGLLGEEADHGTGTEDLQWLCDPLDGTVPFILGIPHTTFILGLTQAGKVLLCVVYNPFTDRLYHAVKGQGAFCNDQPIHVSKQPLQDGYVLVENKAYSLYQALLTAGAILEPVGGAGYRCTLLASGRCAASVQGGVDHHDVGPASLLVEEAGGRVTAYDCSALRYDRPISGGAILSNGVCHDELVALATS